MSLEFKIRPVHPLVDKKYIYSSWYGQVSDHDVAHRNTPQPVLSAYHNRIMESHLANSTWLVASREGGEDEDDFSRAWMSGYVCATLTDAVPVVHMVYIRRRYRGHGLGSNLMASVLNLSPVEFDTVYYSTMTNHTREWARKHKNKTGKGDPREILFLGKKWLYNPYALTQYLPGDWLQGQ